MASEDRSGHWSTCPDCGKRSYTSRKAAKRAASQVTGRSAGRMSAYQCHSGSEYWHVGHLYAATRRGINYSNRKVKQ